MSELWIPGTARAQEAKQAESHRVQLPVSVPATIRMIEQDAALLAAERKARAKRRKAQRQARKQNRK